MPKAFRSGCPLATTLDVIGDKWSLLLVRDMLLFEKTTFTEFSSSPEGISPGMLSTRLKWLETNGLLTKWKLPNNHKENVYLLTDRGIALAPVVAEVIRWGDRTLRERHAEMYPMDALGFAQDAAQFSVTVQGKYRELVANTTGRPGAVRVPLSA